MEKQISLGLRIQVLHQAQDSLLFSNQQLRKAMLHLRLEFEKLGGVPPSDIKWSLEVLWRHQA